MSNRPAASPWDGLGAANVRPAARVSVAYRRHPPALRREVLTAIQRLEFALAICELPIDWLAALQQYRAHRRYQTHPTAANVAAAYGVRGPLPIGVRNVARDLDLAFQRIHTYDPTEHMTQGVVSLVYARKRSKGDTAVLVERFLVRERFVYRSETEQKALTKRAIQMVPPSKRSTVYNVRARLLENASSG